MSVNGTINMRYIHIFAGSSQLVSVLRLDHAISTVAQVMLRRVARATADGSRKQDSKPSKRPRRLPLIASTRTKDPKESGRVT